MTFVADVACVYFFAHRRGERFGRLGKILRNGVGVLVEDCKVVFDCLNPAGFLCREVGLFFCLCLGDFGTALFRPFCNLSFAFGREFYVLTAPTASRCVVALDKVDTDFAKPLNYRKVVAVGF